MADAEANLRTYLLTKTGVTSAFGASNTRIYIDRIEVPAVYPYAIIRTVTEATDYSLTAALKDRTLFQIDVYSNVKSTCNSGADAIKTALSGYSGAMGTMTAGRAFFINTRGGYEPDAQLFRRSMDVEITQDG
jgi:hypothetical protein